MTTEFQSPNSERSLCQKNLHIRSDSISRIISFRGTISDRIIIKSLVEYEPMGCTIRKMCVKHTRVRVGPPFGGTLSSSTTADSIVGQPSLYVFRPCDTPSSPNNLDCILKLDVCKHRYASMTTTPNLFFFLFDKVQCPTTPKFHSWVE
jgi:hypothetical protein